MLFNKLISQNKENVYPEIKRKKYYIFYTEKFTLLGRMRFFCIIFLTINVVNV